MKILVTGCAGFIGFHVAAALLRDGHRVTGLDNFNDYYSVALKRDRFAQLAPRPGFSGLDADICDAARLDALCRKEHFDVVCHLAAQAGVRYSMTNPGAYVKSNLEGFVNVLEACRHAQTPRLVYASSSSVYGGNTKLPFAESDPVDRPVSLYAATKRADELMAHTYSHLFGFECAGLRFFTVYGPWGRPDMALWTFTEALLAGRPIPVFNHGRMQRDFTFIDDIVSGVCAALARPLTERASIFNLGNHRAENLLDMIRILGQALGVEPRLELLPMQPGDVETTYADIDKARALLGFEPATPIASGIPRFVKWYKEYHRL